MDYFVVQISTPTEGAVAPAVFHYNNLDDALASFYDFMHYQIIVGTTQKAIAKIIDENANDVKVEVWNKQVIPVLDNSEEEEEPIEEP